MFLMRRSWWNSFALTPTHYDIRFADGHWCGEHPDDVPLKDFADNTENRTLEHNENNEEKRGKRIKVNLCDYWQWISSQPVYLSIIIISGTCYRKSTFGFQCVRHLNGIWCKRCSCWRLLTSEAEFNKRYGECNEQAAD